jgi:hypothetical protein
LSVGLRWFLWFLAALTAGFVGLAFYLGPNVLGFLFHEGRRTEPFVMVHLLRVVDRSDTTYSASELSDAVFGLGKDQGGKLLWSAQVDGVAEGAMPDGWTSIALVRYPSRAAYVDLVTGVEYRKAADVRRRFLARSAMFVAAARASLEDHTTEDVTTPLRYGARFLRFRSDRAAERYFAEWLEQDVGVVKAHHGGVAWEARLDTLVGDEADRYDHVLIAAFPDDASLDEWASDPHRATLQTLEKRLMESELVMTLTPERREALPTPLAQPSGP